MAVYSASVYRRVKQLAPTIAPQATPAAIEALALKLATEQPYLDQRATVFAIRAAFSVSSAEGTMTAADLEKQRQVAAGETVIPPPPPTSIDQEIEIGDLGGGVVGVVGSALPRVTGAPRLALDRSTPPTSGPRGAAETARAMYEGAGSPSEPCGRGQYRDGAGRCREVKTMDQARTAAQQAADWYEYTQAVEAARSGGDDMSIWGTILDIGGGILEGYTGIDIPGVGFPTGGGGGTLPGGAPAPAPLPMPTQPAGTLPLGYPMPQLVPTSAGPCPSEYPIEIAGRCLSTSGAVWLPGGAPGSIPATPSPQPVQPVQAGGAVGCPSGFHPNKSDYHLRDGTFVAKGTRCVRNRRRNALNPRAASRAMSRLVAAKKAVKQLSRVTIRKSC